MKKILNLFKGRINRLNFLIGFCLTVVILVAGMQVELLIAPTFIFIFIFSYSLQLRRWHDFNKSWTYLLGFIIFSLTLNIISKELSNIAKLICGVFLIVYPGNGGKNRFGDEDKTIGLKSILGLYK